MNEQPLPKLPLDTIIQGDALEVMRRFPDKIFDVAITDPPYGEGIARMGFINPGGMKTGVAKNRDYRSNCPDWDNERPPRTVVENLLRVSKNQVIFGGNFLADVLPPSRCWIVWDKRGDDKYTNDYADCELMWTSFDRPSRIIRYLWNGMIQENMRRKEVRCHPTQKPLKVMERLLEMFTSEGDVVLDPFFGSGTTGIAARRLRRHFVGVELNPVYCKLAADRLRPYLEQQVLAV